MFSNAKRANGLNAIEPSFMVEFKELSSKFDLVEKEDSDEISSDGEFNDARKIKVYDEGAPEVYKIETEKMLYGQGYALDSAEKDQLEHFVRTEGGKSTRNKGLKHFKKVGYMGIENKEIPRWAADDNMLTKVLQR